MKYQYTKYLFKGDIMVSRIVFLVALFAVTSGIGVCFGDVDVVAEPYLLDTGLLSRSISFENPTGAPGQGGKAASKLGVGRKGSPAITLNAGQEVQLCDIEGPGTIRHIWMTTSNSPLNLRSLVIRAWWDGQDHPSIECPIGDFMGFAHGKVMPYHSAVHSLGRNAGMNIWLPMPFTKRAKITLKAKKTCRCSTKLITRLKTSTRMASAGCMCCSEERIRQR
jgi:hypothetical protein